MVERATADLVRREVVGASALGPVLALALAMMAAVSTAQSSVVEFTLAQVAVWVAVAACAFCLSALGSVAGVVVAAATAPLVVAFLTRGADLTIWLAALMTVAACFVVRMLGENFRMFAEIVRSRFAIAEKQRAAEKARQAAMAIALTDHLTALPNRRCFQGLLADRASAAARPFAVGLIDLDGFKPINDMHGHPAGDEILRQVAGRIARAMNGRGSAARMGGDEFAILCDGIGARDQAIALGDEIQSIFATPFAVDGLEIALTGACGFALFPVSAAEPDELVRLADAALYRAKASGRGGVAVFDATSESARRATARARRRAVSRIEDRHCVPADRRPDDGPDRRLRIASALESLRARADRSRRVRSGRRADRRERPPSAQRWRALSSPLRLEQLDVRGSARIKRETGQRRGSVSRIRRARPR